METVLPKEKGALFSKLGALVCTGIFAADISLMLPLLSLRMAGAGETPATIGMLGVCAAIGGILAPFFVTRLVESIGLANLALGSLALVTATIFLFKASEGSVPLWFILFATNSLGISAVFVISEALIISSSSMSSRGLTLGVYASIYSLGTIVGPAVLATTGTDGWPPYLAAASLPALAAAVFVAIRATSGGELPDSSADSSGTGIAGVIPLMGLGMACAFSHGAMEITVLNLLPVYASEIGYGDREVAALLSFMGLGGAVFFPLIGWYAGTRTRMVRTLAVACVVLTLGMPAIYAALSAGASWLLYALMATWGAALGAVYLVGLISIALRFSGLKLVAASAFFAQAFSAGMLIGPAAAGVAMEILLPPHGLLIMLALLGTLPALAYGLSPRMRT